ALMSLQRRWDVVALRAAVAWLLLAWCPRAFALNPGLDVSQYAHAAWRVREGFSKGAINAIAQTPDGYLWLGTEIGLLRFDGVRNVTWQPPPGQHLPSNVVSSLLVGRDGTLWIGTFAGLASWDGRMLTQYGDLAGRAVGKLVEDRDGAVWAGGFPSSPAPFCAIAKGRVECYGGDGRLGPGVTGLYADSHGRLWVGVMT